MVNRKKVILIYPFFPSGLFASVSPGLLSLAGHIAAFNPNLPIRIWDERLDGEYDPADVEGALVGISVMTAQAPRAKRIAERAMEAGAWGIVFGGIHPTVRPLEFYHLGSVVKGEIEGGSFSQVLSDYENGRQLAREYYAPAAPLINLPSTPSEFYEYASRGADHQVSSSRGCPLNCSYCSINIVAGNKVRHRPVEDVLAELRARGLLDGNAERQLSFTDDAFGLMPQDRTLLQGIRDGLSGTGFRWLTQLGLRSLNDDSFLALMNSVGTAKPVVGVESPFREGLGTEKRGIENIDPLRVFEKVRDYTNILPRLLLMVGFDFEPIDVFEQMLAFIEKVRPEGVYISILTPFPGTQIGSRLKTVLLKKTGPCTIPDTSSSSAVTGETIPVTA